MEWNNTNISIFAGMFLFAGITLAIVLPLAFSSDTIVFLTEDGGTPTPCAGNTGLVLAQNITDLCDVTVISPVSSQILRFNGSQWVNANQAVFSNESTTCNNIGSGVILCAGDNVNIKRLTAQTGISITNDSNTVYFANTGVTGLVASTGISINSSTGMVTITNILPESTVCGNVGTGTTIHVTGSNCNAKSLKAGSGLSIANDSNSITYTNTSPESTVCSGQSSNYNIVASSSGGNCTFKNLLAGSNIALSFNSTHVTISVTGITSENTVCNNLGSGTIILNTQQSCVSAKSLKSGTGLSIANTTNDITYTNTGVISNSCTTPIVCSGTNPSAISFSDNPYWQQLCQSTLPNNLNTTLTCTFTSKTNLIIISSIRINNAGTGLELAYQFNADTGTNYGVRTSSNGAADTTSTNSNQCRTQTTGVLWNGNDGGQVVLHVYNFASVDRKLATGLIIHGIDTADTTSPLRIEQACKYDNQTNLITRITFMSISGTSTFGTGSQVTVWGYN